MKSKGFFLLLFIVSHFTSVGQNTIGLPQIINYDKNDYHGGSQTWNIGQDDRGIMYFANNEGLVTFDGFYWKVYPLPHKTIMRSLAIGGENKVYAGGQGEFGYFSPDRNGIMQFTSLVDLVPDKEKTFADIWKTVIYKDAVFFQASDRIFEYKNDRIRVFLAKNVWQYIGKSGDKLFAQDRMDGVYEFKDDQWYPVAKTTTTVNITGIMNLGTDSFLISSQKNGLFIMNGQKISPFVHNAKETLPEHINYSARINMSEYVAGTRSDGCIIFDRNGNIIQKIRLVEGLQNNNVQCVFIDKDGNIWAGLNNGISFIDYSSAIKYIRPDKQNEVLGYSSIIHDHKLYIATSDGTYVAPLKESGKDFSFSIGSFSLIKNTMGETWKIDEVNQQLLIGHNDGVFQIKGMEASPVLNGSGCWIFIPMTQVFPAKKILVGTYTGLRELDYENGHFISNEELKGMSESFRFLTTDNDGGIWASHPYRGVYRITLSADGKSYSAKLYTDKDGLPSTLENYVFRIRNRVVFATKKGIYEFNHKTNKFEPSTVVNNIFRNLELRYLREDGDGNIWFCSGKKIGVASFEPDSKPKKYTITYFPELAGQILSGFESIYPFNKENIFISSEKGIIHLNYAKYASKQKRIKVLLGAVTAIGKKDSLLFGGFFHSLKDSVFVQDEQKVPRLSSSYNSFHFEYSSPSYGLQSNIEYSYQLSGYDPAWSEWSTKTEKDYTNLSSGNYVFKIKARDNLGNESQVVSFAFVVQPPWYATIWAKLFYAVLIFIAGFMIYKWQERKFESQRVKYEEEQRRINELHQLKLEKREKEIIKLQNEKLADEVKYKSRELADAAIHLEERNSALTRVKSELEKIYKRSGNDDELRQTLLLLKNIERNNSTWEQFATHFDELNNDFLKKLKDRFQNMTNNDFEVCTYLKLNLSTKEIAQLMNISIRGTEISRYRLRKKLDVPRGKTITDFLNEVVLVIK